MSYYRQLIQSIVYLLDNVPSSSVAYSLRQLRSDYTGSVIRVRRSGDNAEQNIGFASNGSLDIASLLAFVGSNNGFVHTWYDQSGNNNHATQTTPANQPQIVNAGSIITEGDQLPSIFFSGTASLRFTAVSLGTTYSLITVSNRSSIRGTAVLLGHTTAGNLNSDGGNYVHNSGGSFVVTTLAWLANVKLLTTLIRGGTSSFSIFRNSSTSTTASLSSNNGLTLSRIGIRDDLGTNLAWLGYSREIVVYPTNQSANRSLIEGNINSYYGIY